MLEWAIGIVGAIAGAFWLWMVTRASAIDGAYGREWGFFRFIGYALGGLAIIVALTAGAILVLR